VPLRPVSGWPAWEQRAWQKRGATLTVAVQAAGKPSHGRVERRELWALADPVWNRQVGELGAVGQPWPHVQQLWRLTRRRTDPRTGETSVEVTLGISSLPPARADAERHLSMIRSYWGIENRLHHVRDVTMGEDASQVRTDAAPQVVAGLRNVTLALLRRSGVSNIAERLRTFAGRPAAAVALVLGRSPP
jgi:hypothetical protein